MAYLPELHRCHVCGADLGADDGDGLCSACDNALEQVSDYFERKHDALRAACQMALDHGEKKQYTWRHVRAVLCQALGYEADTVPAQASAKPPIGVDTHSL
jgi:predicted amidophosphoribosyltransferase